MICVCVCVGGGGGGTSIFFQGAPNPLATALPPWLECTADWAPKSTDGAHITGYIVLQTVEKSSFLPVLLSKSLNDCSSSICAEVELNSLSSLSLHHG